MHVESEAISDIDYDEVRAKLFVRFIDGDQYVYVGVPGEVHRSFVDAESKGRFFAAEIRDQYPYNKLDEA
jgi:lysyl-tRNA synthetase class 2